MDGFSEDESVVVVAVNAALRLEAALSNKTISIVVAFITGSNPLGKVSPVSVS
jgi:hypothetical protein